MSLSDHIINNQLDNDYEPETHVCSNKMYGVMMFKCVYHLMTHKYDIYM